MRSFRGDPKAGGNSSRGFAAPSARLGRSGRAAPLILAAGAIAALCMLAAEATTLFEIDVSGQGCEDAVADPALADQCVTTGAEQHSFALVLIGLLTAAMAVGAGLGGSRPAALALLGAGLLVLGIALLGDLPDATSTGQVGTDFTNAEAVKGPALWFEVAGGSLAVLAGVLRLALPRRTEAG